MRDDQASNEGLLRLCRGGQPPPAKRARYVDSARKLQALKTELDNQQRTLSFEDGVPWEHQQQPVPDIEQEMLLQAPLFEGYEVSPVLQTPLFEGYEVSPVLQTTVTPVIHAETDAWWQPEVECGTALQQTVLPHPGNCAWYLNCSFRPDAVMETYHGDLVLECPYPQLFSTASLQCEDFEQVDCQERHEPKSPCEYRANHCQETAHCIPCWVRYASCVGEGDGLHPWSALLWQPFFVQCYRQRTVFQGSCNKSSVFSPLTRTCKTPSNMSHKHGAGWPCHCPESRDGKYPDENGRCEWCQDGVFMEDESCADASLFGPDSKNC
ncbi:hypothetical protein ACOMHN_038797 [Nucella lapillus]